MPHKKRMAPELTVLTRTWQSGGTGYVFVAKRRGKNWSDKSFEWPTDRAALESWLTDNLASNSDIYWSPLVYSGPRRSKQLVLNPTVLYADLDPVDPSKLAIKPTVAWESSDGRYQCLWHLEQPITPQEHEALNRALTRSIGADPGGWDLTQVLRVPGALNHKYSPPRAGRLLWDHSTTRYPRWAFNELNAAMAAKVERNDTVRLLELLSQYRDQIGRETSRALQYPPEMVTEGQRSEVLYRLGCELLDAKIPMEDACEILRASAWNKFKGRQNELELIRTGLLKAYDAKTAMPPQGRAARIEPGRLDPTPYAQLMGGLRSSPGWLIKDLWLKGSHGIVAGEPKSYKSTIALDMAASVASGRTLWGQFEVQEAGPVLIVQNENADWIQRDRLQKVMHSRNLLGKVVRVTKEHVEVRWPKKLEIYSIDGKNFRLDSPEDRACLEESVKLIKPKLLILDPLYLMFSGDLNQAQQLQPVLQWLLQLKNEHGVAIMLIHHFNKNGLSTRGGQRLLGSTTLHGWTESGLFAQRAGENRVVTVEREFRAAGAMPRLELRFKMGEMGDPTYKVTMSEVDEGERAQLRSVTEEPRTLSQVAKELKVSPQAAKKLIEADGDLEIVDGPKGKMVRRRGA